jgi:hypothetical protein
VHVCNLAACSYMGHCLFPPPQNLNMLWARCCLVPLSCPCSCLGAGPCGPCAAPRPSRGAFLLPPDPVGGGVVHPPGLVRSPGFCQQACPGRRKLCSLAVRDFLRVPWWLFRGLGLFEHLCNLQLGSGSLFLGHIGSSAAGLRQSWSLQRRDDRPVFVHSWAALQLGSGSLSLVHLGGFAAWQWFFALRAPCGFAAWNWEPDLRTPPWRCIWQWGPVLGTPCSFAMMAASSYTLVASSLAAGEFLLRTPWRLCSFAEGACPGWLCSGCSFVVHFGALQLGALCASPSNTWTVSLLGRWSLFLIHHDGLAMGVASTTPWRLCIGSGFW